MQDLAPCPTRQTTSTSSQEISPVLLSTRLLGAPRMVKCRLFGAPRSLRGSLWRWKHEQFCVWQLGSAATLSLTAPMLSCRQQLNFFARGVSTPLASLKACYLESMSFERARSYTVQSGDFRIETSCGTFPIDSVEIPAPALGPLLLALQCLQRQLHQQHSLGCSTLRSCQGGRFM